MMARQKKKPLAGEGVRFCGDKSIPLTASPRGNRLSPEKLCKANAANAIAYLYLPPAQLGSIAGGRFSLRAR
jgi:hypothetical protein